MNIKYYSFSVIAGFIFVALYDYVVHGMLLVPTYNLTPQLWRPMEEFQTYAPFMVLMHLLTVSVLCFIYTRHHEGKGIAEGVRFGIMFGVLLGLMGLASYTWMPISLALAIYWFVASVFKVLGLGIIFSLIYKN